MSGTRAQKAAVRALEEDGRKAALNSAEENLKAARAAVQHRRFPSALTFALKAVDKNGEEAYEVIGEALLELGLAGAAKVAFERSTRRPRAAVGRARAMAVLHHSMAEVNAAGEAARKQCSSPEKHRLELARLEAVAGRFDSAHETALLVTLQAGLQPGAAEQNEAALIGSEMELAMYAEAAWPQCAMGRPDRRHDGDKPDALVDLPMWRLQRGIEAAHSHGTRIPQCVGASVLAAEMLLECQLYREMLMPRAPRSSRDGSSAPITATAGDSGGVASTEPEQDEIHAIMRMAGVTENKLGDPATALRVIEQQRRKVIDCGGPMAASEAEDLARLHDWQMAAIGRARHLAVAGALLRGQQGGASGAPASATTEVGGALEICNTVLKRVEVAASCPELCLLRGRLLLSVGQPFDAIAPLTAASTLLAPDAAWRGCVVRLLGVSAGTADTAGSDELYLASEMYLGLSQAMEGGPKKFEDFAPRLQLALDRVDSALPPDDEQGCGSLPESDAGLGNGAPTPSDTASSDTADATSLSTTRRDECAICLQPLQSRDRVILLACSHTFHRACMTRWFRRSQCCPVCREPWKESSPVGKPLVRCYLSPVNPDVLAACLRLAAAQADRGMLEEACKTCELAERIYAASLTHLGAIDAGGGGSGSDGLGDSGLAGGPLSGGAPAAPLAIEHSKIMLVWVRSLVSRGQEPTALRVCIQAAEALAGSQLGGGVLNSLLSCGGLLVDQRAKDALDVFGDLSTEWAMLAPHCARAHEMAALSKWLAYDADPLADARPGGPGEKRLREAKKGYEHALALEGKPQGTLEATAEAVIRKRREAHEARAAAAAAAAAAVAATEAKEAAAAETARKEAAGTTGHGRSNGKAPEARAGLKAAAGKAISAKSAARAMASKAAVDGKGASKGMRSASKEAAGSGAAAVKALSAAMPAQTAATSAEHSVAAPEAASLTPATPVAASDVPRAHAPVAAPPAADSDETVPATELAEAVTLARAERAEAHTPRQGPTNARSVGARLGVVHVTRALGEPLGPLRTILEEALQADETARHDRGLYEELGRILREEDPMAAVDLYCSFPFSGDADFGENALRLAAIKTLLSQKKFDDERIKPLLISIGKGFGVRQVTDEVDVLDRAGKTQLCKEIYMGITGLSEENSRGFFQSKGWARSFTSAELAAGSLPPLRAL